MIPVIKLAQWEMPQRPQNKLGGEGDWTFLPPTCSTFTGINTVSELYIRLLIVRCSADAQNVLDIERRSIEMYILVILMSESVFVLIASQPVCTDWDAVGWGTTRALFDQYPSHPDISLFIKNVCEELGLETAVPGPLGSFYTAS